MDYRYLKAFLATAENKSFSKAAEQLKIAQSAVSRQIKLLEQSLDEELIIRSSKKVILTEKGKELFLKSKTFEESLNDLFSREESKVIKIGVLQGLLENWLYKVITEFYKNNPHNLEIKVAPPHILKKLIEGGQLDIIFTPENIQTELISSLKILQENLVIISKNDIDVKNLNQYRWIVYGDDDHLMTTQKKVSPQVIKVESVSTIVNFVRSGLGIAVVPDHVLKATDKLHVEAFTAIKKSEIYLSTLNYNTMPKHLEKFISLIR